MSVRVPRCPTCPYTFVRPSRYRIREWPLMLVLRRPYRCGCCKERFFARFFPFDYVVAVVRAWLF